MAWCPCCSISICCAWDYGTEFIGLVNAVGLLTFGLAALPAGILGSRMSTTALMKFGAFLCLFGGALLPMAEWLPLGWREIGLVIPPALMFCGFAFYFVNGAPYLINVVDDAYKHQAFAPKGGALVAGWFLRQSGRRDLAGGDREPEWLDAE